MPTPPATDKAALLLNSLPPNLVAKLMELLGHTPLEVFVGALLGVGSALIWHRIFPR